MNTMVMRISQLSRKRARSRVPTWRPAVPRLQRLLAATLAGGVAALLTVLIHVGDSAASTLSPGCPVPTDSQASSCPVPTSPQRQE
ncbi:hypothetical protein [uncultured Methylibium sp.]|uniref:hypothetical protein n=1 Tax=uncultured Methylibium sp. TaxID=381093 RepID=UPI0025D6CC49|nr:hypothetical protein [uncultured Methylibium sp.]